MGENIYHYKFDTMDKYYDFRDVLILPKKSKINIKFQWQLYFLAHNAFDDMLVREMVQEEGYPLNLETNGCFIIFFLCFIPEFHSSDITP